MARNRRLDRIRLLKKLDPIEPRDDDRKQDQLDQISLAGTLLALAEINHETEYLICRAVAEHLLGAVPEPDDSDLEEFE